MAKEICISTTPHETRLAILEDDQLAEIYYERENEYTLAGSIYKGRVTRVLPGMQSSFVDVGLERDAFLYVTDFLEEQEDSEDFVTEGNGRSRQRGPEEPQGRQAPERSEARGEGSGDRDRDRGPGSGDRSQATGDRGRRSTAPPPSEGRRREQIAAPLREAVPAEEDLAEKGDDETPAGTRRWRGRRGRRRGVRAGLPHSQTLLSDSPEALEEASTAEESMAAPFAIAERGAPGGVASLHASPAPDLPGEELAPSRPANDRGRDRGPRRSREPYAQASTLARSEPAGAPAIVLPGESISKYGGVASEAASPAAPTASVPKLPARPVNYVAPKPSTLVEVSAAAWDGGALLPGESISRYGAGSPSVPRPAVEQREPAEAYGTPAEPGLDQVNAEAQPHAQPEQAHTAAATAEAAQAVASHAVPETNRPEPEGEQLQPNQAEPAAHGDERGQAKPAEPERSVAPLAEPELLAAALSPAAEATPAAVPEPVIEPTEVAGPADYEPENASASYRVTPPGSVELRLSPELEPAASEEPSEGFEALAAQQVSEAPAVPEFAGELAGPDAPQSLEQQEPAAEHHPARALTILHEDGSIDAVPTPVQESEGRAEDAIQSEAQNFQSASLPDEPREESQDEPQDERLQASAFEFHLSPEAEAQQADAAQAASPSEFSQLVDQLHGFAPGPGLLEEEVIDEEEYDFEPMHAHLELHRDDHDQEDLEEETLDHQMDASTLSDAVRDSHLEQRVHRKAEPASQAAGRPDELAAFTEEDEAPFGFEEVDEDEEAEADAVQTAQPGEPQRRERSDEGRNRGRGGRSGGRNGGRHGGPGRSRSAQTQDLPIITDLLKQGQEILVQIAKEPIAKKGARITSHIALPGRFLVFMPTVNHVGVSRKIASDEERQRLKRILVSEKGDSQGGFIVRTAADGASEEDLRADLRFLISLWTEIKQRSDSAKAPALIYHDLNLIERILRDQVSSNFATIWVDSEAEYERIIRFLNRFQPGLVRRVKLYTKETPLFEHFGIQEEISKALKSKVWLKSGGSIVINQTEALVAIDINTGKYVGKTARLEDTIVKTNLDAIPEIVRQIRLRDLGGIIVIDFIDMDERKNRNRVLAALEEELKHDRAPSKVLQFNDFGLVAITRKRVKQSLERTLSVQCETCTGTGMVKSPITVCNEIYIEMRKMLKHLEGKDVMLRVHPEVVKQLKAGNGKWINELEEMIAKTIIIKSDASLHPEQFDIH